MKSFLPDYTVSKVLLDSAHDAMHHEAVKPFLNGGLYDNIFGHFFPPIDTARDCHKPFAICFKLIIRVCFEM